MTPRQIDKLIGKTVRVRFPRWNEQTGVPTITKRRVRSRVIETADGGVYEASEIEFVEVVPYGTIL